MLFWVGILPVPSPCLSWAMQSTVYIVIYGYLQAATTNLYKANDGTTARPTAKSAYEWAVYCSLTPVLTAM